MRRKYHPHSRKGWKKSRSKQQRTGGRGEKHSIYIEGANKYHLWDFEKYCFKHDIPYRLEEKTTTEKCSYKETKSVAVRYVPAYTYASNPIRQHQVGYKWIYKTVETGRIITYNRKKVLGCTITWWSDKDIGIEYILKECEVWKEGIHKGDKYQQDSLVK